MTDTFGNIGSSTLSPATITTKREQFRERIGKFLVQNKWIDEMLAIKLGTEVREWALVNGFCESRGLQRQLLHVLTSIFKSELSNYSATEYSVQRPNEFKGATSKFVYSSLSLKGLQDITTKMISDMPMRERRGFLNCLVNPDNLLACIDDPELGIELLDILLGALPFLDETQLESAVVQTEPRRCGFRPIYLYPILLKSKRYFTNAEKGSSISAPSSMLHNDAASNQIPEKLISGYKLIQTALNFYVNAQLLLIKMYMTKLVENQNVSLGSGSSQLKEVNCDENILPKKISSCDVNLVKTLINNEQNNYDKALIKQSCLKTDSAMELFSTEEKNQYVRSSVTSPTSEVKDALKDDDSFKKSTLLKYKLEMLKRGCSLLATGPNHVLLNRLGGNVVMSWGCAEFGALGHNNLTATNVRFSPPREVSFLRSINNVYTISKKTSSDDGDDFEYRDIASADSTCQFEADNESMNNLSPPITVFSLACGKTHSLALTDRGLYSWGSSKYGQLGLGYTRQKTKRPEMVSTLANYVISSITCGHYHSVALDIKGRLWTWGWGVHGQLGLHDIEDEHRPKRVRQPQQLFSEGIGCISAGYAHTMVSTLAGYVWVFGCGLFGQLGNGENKKSTVPIKVDFMNAINSEGVMNDKICLINCGYFHNLAVSKDRKRLYTWGCNPQLLRQEAQQKKKERLQNALIGKINSSKENNPSNNNANNCNSKEENIEGNESVVNKNSAESDTKELSTSPTSFHEQKSLKKEKENEMVHLIPSLLDTSMVEGDIVDVACGNQHSLILSSKGVVYGFGRNLEGQLGIGTRNREVKIFTPLNAISDDFILQISCGGDYSAALSESGTLFCWGHNSCGQLGKPPLVEDNQGAGKTEIIGSKGKVMLLKTSKLNSKITKLQHGTNYGILQNTCDIPKPILGLNSGVYSDESIDEEAIHKNVLSCIQRLQSGLTISKQIKPKYYSGVTKLDRSRELLHSCIETFHPHLDHKKLIKKCLISDNPQAAAKLSLVSIAHNGSLQAFEFTLQALIKQIQPISADEISKDIFDAFYYYLHYNVKYSEGAEDGQKRQNTEKRQLTERLIACWQDQSFSFEQLEKLIMEKTDPLLLQVLVLTLFCPEEERDISDGPILNNADFCGTKLVNLFTPDFCLTIGDAFVQNMVDADPDEGFVSGSSKLTDEIGLSGKSHLPTNASNCPTISNRRRKIVVSKWLEKQRSKETELDLPQSTGDVFNSEKHSLVSQESSIDFEETPFSNIEDVLNVLPEEFYASSKDSNDKDEPRLGDESALTDLVNKLMLDDNS